ncbi:MAG TPA: zinc-binding alcohol dehydrogenase [Candidatus Polarisedimenticolia bacterium]|nr:zinc-binding alcohol dehydrogenase [Candidatus Polarisedimenticolia bacterium]
MTTQIDDLVARGEIGGRTVRILESGEVDCHEYPIAPLAPGHVRVRTMNSAISPGTEMTYIGAGATNPFLTKRWEPDLRLFVAGSPSVEYPIVFGYRAAGKVVESAAPAVPVGTRIYGKWRHTELVALAVEVAVEQRVPDGLTFDDAVDLGQMAPIAMNAIAYAGDELRGTPAVVFGAGPVGLIVAQIAAASGASAVHVVDRIASRLEVARSRGLETLLSADGVDVARELKLRLGAEGVAVVFECTGSTRALQEAIRTVRRRGRVVAVGFYQGEAAGLFLGDEFHHNGVEIRSAQIGNIHPAWSMALLRARVIELALAGRLALGSLPRVTFPVEKAAEAFAAIKKPDTVLQAALAY